MPSGYLWHGLMVGNLQTLCGRIPLRDSIDAAIQRQQAFPPGPSDLNDYQVSRRSCDKCMQIAEQLSAEGSNQG